MRSSIRRAVLRRILTGQWRKSSRKLQWDMPSGVAVPGNTAIGFQALASNVSGTGNIAVGLRDSRGREIGIRKEALDDVSEIIGRRL